MIYEILCAGVYERETGEMSKGNVEMRRIERGESIVDLPSWTM